MGFELSPEAMKAIVGDTIDFEYVRDFKFEAPIRGEALVMLTMALKPDQIQKLNAIIKAGIANL